MNTYKKLIGNKEDEEGFELVEIKSNNNLRKTPYCKIHGAMNCIKSINGDLIWRCYSQYGYGELKENQTIRRFHDRVCNACCVEKMENLKC